MGKSLRRDNLEVKRGIKLSTSSSNLNLSTPESAEKNHALNPLEQKLQEINRSILSKINEAEEFIKSDHEKGHKILLEAENELNDLIKLRRDNKINLKEIETAKACYQYSIDEVRFKINLAMENEI